MLLVLLFCFALSAAHLCTCGPGHNEGQHCGEHEVPNEQHIICQPTCLDVQHHRDHPPICPLNCIPNPCICAPGYVRNHNHTYCNEPNVRCIPKSSCNVNAERVKRDENRQKCPPHEKFNDCGRVCEKNCTSVDDNACPKRCDPPSCTCKRGYVRHQNRCIKPKHCRKYGVEEPTVYGAQSFAAVPLLTAMSCSGLPRLACVTSCKLACRVLGPLRSICEEKCLSEVCACSDSASFVSQPGSAPTAFIQASSPSAQAGQQLVEFGIRCNSICKAGCDLTCNLLSNKMNPTCKAMCLENVCKCKNAALLALDVPGIADEDMDEDEEEEESKSSSTVLASSSCSGIKGTLCKQGCKVACKAVGSTLKPACISACLKNVCKCPVPTKALELLAQGSDAEDREAEEFDETPTSVVVLSSLCSGIKGTLCKAGCKLPCKKLNGVLQQTCLKLCYKNICQCPTVARFASESVDQPTSIFELLAEQPENETTAKGADFVLPPCADDQKTRLCKSVCEPVCQFEQNATAAFVCNSICVAKICRCNLNAPSGVSVDPAVLRHALDDADEITTFSDHQLDTCPITDNTTMCIRICQYPCNAYRDELRTMCTKLCLGQTCRCRLDKPGSAAAPSSEPQFAYLSKQTELESHVLGSDGENDDRSSSEEDDEHHHHHHPPHHHHHNQPPEFLALNTCGSGIKTTLCIQGCKLPCKLLDGQLKKICQNVCIQKACKCVPPE